MPDYSPKASTKESLQAPDPGLDSFTHAYLGLAKSIGEAWFPPELQDRAERTRQDLQNAAGDPHKQFEISRAWAQALAEAANSQQIRERLQSAFQDYLRELQRAWGGVDPSALGPWHLAVISRSQRAAACWAYWYAWLLWPVPQRTT